MVEMVPELERVRSLLRDAIAGRAKPAWVPPVRDDFAYHRKVLAFDAALRNTGWVILVNTRNYGPGCLAHGTIRLTTEERSYLATWDLAWQLRKAVFDVIQEAGTDFDIVVEAPSVGGGHRTESSLVAGLQVWQQGQEHRKIVVPVAADHVSTVLCGNRRHDKKEIAAAVAKWIPGSERRDWTEHERDAAAAGLANLYDRVHPRAAA